MTSAKGNDMIPDPPNGKGLLASCTACGRIRPTAASQLRCTTCVFLLRLLCVRTYVPSDRIDLQPW